jgi:copper transport protein
VVRKALGVAAVAAAVLALPAHAAAHATVERTVPEQGAKLRQAPSSVEFVFNEPVEASFGAVHVYDASGRQLDEAEPFRPGDRAEAIGVRLPDDLGDGSYTATYRVVSADSHPISGGFGFTVGKAGGSAGPGVGELIDSAGASPAMDAGFGAVRALGYLATALVVGGLVFAFAVWGPALASLATGRPEWAAASEVASARLGRMMVIAALLGAAAGALMLVFQGATAAGISFASALRPEILEETLRTRFGAVNALRSLAFLAAAALIEIGRRRAAGPIPGRSLALAAAIPIGYLLVAPALAGHATTQEPVWALLPADVIHVTAMSVWVGGVAALLLAVPTATQRLQPADRSRLLIAVLIRFSTVALVAVAALLATGVLQSVIHLERVPDLIDTAFGRSIAVKAALLGLLIALGAVNRYRIVPALRRRGEGGESPGEPGVTLRRVLIGELALMTVVLGVTAALVSYPPPDALAQGPQSGNTSLGPARLDWTVDPAQVGANQIHIYLFDPGSGEQYDELKQLQVAISNEGVGTLDVRPSRAGPGHYVVRDAPFGAEGEWEVALEGRVSAFDENRTTFDVEIG